MTQFAKGHFLVLIGVMALSLAALEIRPTQAHGGLLSPYKYNEDIFPILRDRCGRCHVEGGPAPMSLVVHAGENGNGAQAWARGIRDLVVSEQMPPWYVDPVGPAIRGGNPITAREADKLITWAIGKAPSGEPAKKPAPVEFRTEWRGGAPDLKIAMESEHTLPAGTTEETREFVLSTGLADTRWVKAVDLLPGAGTIVRNAVISIDNGPILTVWVPGDDLVMAPSGAAFKLPAGAKLRLQIHYKKQWQLETEAVSDRSTVGLYFTDPPASGRELQALTIDGPSSDSGESKAFTGTLAGNARVVAVRPSLDQVYGSVTVQAVTPTGTKVPLLILRAPRPEWRRRYWLAEPVELPAGSKIEVSVAPPPPHIDLTGARLIKGYPLQVALDFVPQS